MRLPHYSSAMRLFALGNYNTLSELLRAQSRSQFYHLSLTSAWLNLLLRLGYPLPTTILQKTYTPVPDRAAQALSVHPIPRNMHPEYNSGRCRAMVQLLICMLEDLERFRTMCTDEAHNSSALVAAIVNGGDELVDTVSARSSTTPVLGVELAIRDALCLLQTSILSSPIQRRHAKPFC